MDNTKSPTGPNSSDIPWLMQLMHTLFCKEPEEPDWLDVFRQHDPRKRFTTELCKACYSAIVDVDCSAQGIHVINKDETAIDQLMIFLHDGACACAADDARKTRLEFCLLDAIAASGSVAALRACVNFIQNSAAHKRILEHTDSCKCSTKRTPFARDFPKRKSTTATVSDPRADSKSDKNESQGFTEGPPNISAQRKVYEDPDSPADSSASRGTHRLLFSPNCHGGFVERRPFPVEEPSILEEDTLVPESGSCSLPDALLYSNPYNSEVSDIQNESAPNCPKPVKVKDIDNHPVGHLSILNVSHDDTDQNLLDPSKHASAVSDTASVVPEWTCKAPTPDGKSCPLACCFRQADVDSLRAHLDQTSLLSMAAQALYYNQESMVVCARALTSSSLSELVRMCGNFPVTEASLYLYFMSIEEEDKFVEVAPEDRKNLYSKTLPVEVSRLCQLAWQKTTPTDYFFRARSTTFYIDLCRDCEETLFPDAALYGKTAYVKFWRDYEQNAPLFACIRASGCACPVRTGSFAVYQEIAAAASGNIDMFKAVSEPFLVDELKRSRRSDLSGNGRKALKPCTKGFKSAQRPGVTVDFNSEVEHLGESRVGSALRHALYGGSDAIVLHILKQMNQWPLRPEESIACLQMCLLMGRDDMFFRLSLHANLEAGSANFTKSSAGTPLMMAASYGRMLLVNLLLARGADPVLENLNGVTAIEMALESNYKDSELIALRMLSAVSDPHLGKTLVAGALFHRKLRVAEYLIGRGVRTAYSRPTVWARVRSLSELEVPLVHWWLIANSIRRDATGVLAFLLSLGLEVNTKDAGSGATPLHTAVTRSCNPKVLALLLSHGARVNARTADGATPLHSAVQVNHVSLMAPLVRAGASFCDPDSKLFNMAVSLRRFQVILLLLHAGYKPTTSDMEALAQLGPRVPEPIQVLISTVRSEPVPLPTLCAASLREALQGGLNGYLDSVGCPDVVRRFIHLEHLFQRFLDPVSWNRILQWEV